MTRPADDGREDSSGRVVTGEPSLAHAGAIVDHKRGNVVVTHLGWLESETAENGGSEQLLHALTMPLWISSNVTSLTGYFIESFRYFEA